MYEYLFLFIVLTLIGYMYEKYEEKNRISDEDRNKDLIRKYLLGENKILSNKRNLWIYLDFEYNTRDWLSFNSRKTEKLNQPYKLLCLQSIINKSGGDYNICILDDNSFHKLLPNWNINLRNLSNPIKCHMVSLGLSKILYEYGGILCPSSYLALEPIYKLDELCGEDTYIMESNNKNVTAKYSKFLPTHRFMGCNKKSKVIGELVNYLENLNSRDYTDESNFLGCIDRKCYEYVYDGKMKLVDGKYIGVKDNNCENVLVDNLLQNSYIDYSKELYGILIPDKEILKRFKYEWFASLSANEVLSSNTILGNYFVNARLN